MEDNFEAILNKYETPQEPQESAPTFESILDKYENPQDSSSSFESILNKYEDPQEPSVPEDQPLVTFTPEGKPQVNAESYSENDLKDPKFLKPIREYMMDRFGTHHRDTDPDKLINQYLNNMRGFAAGNSVRSVSELAYMNGVDSEERLRKAQAGWAIYEGMEGMFGDTTGRERLGIAGDFLRTALLDPTNLLSLGIGKIATSGGTKLAIEAAQSAAHKKMRDLVAKGISRKEAVKVANRTFLETQKDVMAKAATERTKREVIRKQVADSVYTKVMNKTALKEIAVTGAVDSVAAVATDYMYQDVMIRGQIQDEYSVFQTGLAALGGVIGAGMSAGLQLKTRTKMAAPESLKLTRDGLDVTELGDVVTAMSRMKLDKGKAVPRGEWAREGIEVADLDTDFFIRLMIGDDELGVKGLSHLLAEQGYGFSKRDPDDTITQFMGDILRGSDERSFDKLMDSIKGVDPDNPLHELSKMNKEDFANAFVDKMTGQAKVMNAASQVSRVLGKEATLEEYVHWTVTGEIPTAKTKLEGGKTLVDALMKKVGKEPLPEGSVSGLQNRLIRLLVSNLSTTNLNVTGWAAATSLDSVSDLTAAALFSPVQIIRGKMTPKQWSTRVADAYKNVKFKASQAIDPNMTYDDFMQYAEVRPGAMKGLLRMLPGGVENLDKMAKDFDPNMTLAGVKSDEGIRMIQMLSMVTPQDIYTKSIEFTSQMDKLLRKNYNKGYKEFFESADYRKIMATKEYAMLEAKAVDDTMTNIFSKSYKGKGSLGELAGAIEDARNVPGIGMLMPFGRFFNNTIAFMSDNMGISLIGRALFRPKGATYSVEELASRTAVTYTLIGAMALREKEYIKQGLSWNQETDTSGAVIDEKYEFPYSAIKAAARLAAYGLLEDEEAPPEMIKDIRDTHFGQLTRNLDASGQSMMNTLDAILSGDGEQITSSLMEMTEAVVSQSVSAGTRFVDPLNAGVGLLRGEDQMIPDRNQGNSMVRKSLRYMDQFLMAAGVEMETAYAPTKGEKTDNPSKFLSTKREERITDMDRVFNMIGRPNYKAGVQTSDGATKNRYNQLFNRLNQLEARKLLRDPKFKDGDLERRAAMVSEMMSKSKAKVLRQMRASPGDREGALILEIEGLSSEMSMKNVLKEFGYDSVDDLSYFELLNIRNALENRERHLRSR